jgi:hypothetical protein
MARSIPSGRAQRALVKRKNAGKSDFGSALRRPQSLLANPAQHVD